MSEWQPIETAPKDVKILIWFSTLFGGMLDVGTWNDDRYARKPRPYWTGMSEHTYGILAYRNGSPTHWMPLPAPPSEA